MVTSLHTLITYVLVLSLLSNFKVVLFMHFPHRLPLWEETGRKPYNFLRSVDKLPTVHVIDH